MTVKDVKTGKSTTLHTTWHHPFWNTTTKRWTDAKDLKAGDRLRDANGSTAQIVTAIKIWTGPHWMRDLTVEDIHTYYVLAGDQPVLVHNCNTRLTQDQADTLRVGPQANESVPATGPTVTGEQSAAMQGLPCHTCGEVNPNVTMVGDHQPPSGLSPIGGPQDLYPQCPGTCIAGQGTAVQRAQQILRNHGVYNPNALGAYETLLELLPGHTEG
ncbi:polymorphic toxin-type HINT domain-containing protein [Hamadaea sp. NPDC051192]|uniref:polymorphic toxin-type HINT domain-containing protein n=1 Tax=Hamadaea sp. NPDC051192 TaxID=3154940 RepID=UPI00343836E1